MPYFFLYRIVLSTHIDKALANLKENLILNLSLETGLGNRLEKAAGGFMTRLEAQNITQEPTKNKQIGALIELLRTKADPDYHTFLQMLRDSNYTAWANELEKVAAEERARGTAHTFGGVNTYTDLYGTVPNSNYPSKLVTCIKPCSCVVDEQECILLSHCHFK